MSTSPFDIERAHAMFDKLADEVGEVHGIPMPIPGHLNLRIVTAPGVPALTPEDLREFRNGHPEHAGREDEDVARFCTAADMNLWRVNVWRQPEVEVGIVRECREGEELPPRSGDYLGKPQLIKHRTNSALTRLRSLVDRIVYTGKAHSLGSEVKAMQALRERVTPWQFRCYVLTGAFSEPSARSGVLYVLRRGLPTLAFGHDPNGSDVDCHFLCALCLHGLAYYQGASGGVGCMPPTDDVLTHLLMIRGDEARFWAKSSQHPYWAVNSGI